jgi:hypothetical protein
MKMKANYQLLASIVLVATASGVHAQSAASATYIEAGIDATRLSASEFESFPTTGRLTLGHNLHPNLAIESTLIFTASEAVEGKNKTSKKKADQITYGVSGAALYLKPKMALSKDTEFFARVGYSSVRYSATINKSNIKNDSLGSFSYGVGIQTNITNKLYAVGSFTMLSKTKGAMAESVGVSLGYRF